jgi:hypothetical protein
VTGPVVFRSNYLSESDLPFLAVSIEHPEIDFCRTEDRTLRMKAHTLPSVSERVHFKMKRGAPC